MGSTVVFGWRALQPESRLSLVLESLSQTRTSFFVVDDRIQKLALSFLNKADDYGDSRFSASRITSS
jgi:hypothetical protein